MSETLAETFRLQYGAAGIYGSPCTAAEIAALEAKVGLRLPAAYRAYLLQAGHCPPPALEGSDCDLSWLHKLRNAACELLKEDACSFELPADAFVFLMHQGYSFLFFHCVENQDDPPVWSYHEGERVFNLSADRFSWWVLALPRAPD